ncbi:hypothetical protein, partial [Novosphingobium sp. AP12]|uniref:hypothetical protein n=1 Tax=Novosphingobium sp. AP12 TaxID=1144305 RepID=UPI000271EC01
FWGVHRWEAANRRYGNPISVAATPTPMKDATGNSTAIFVRAVPALHRHAMISGATNSHVKFAMDFNSIFHAISDRKIESETVTMICVLTRKAAERSNCACSLTQSAPW